MLAAGTGIAPMLQVIQGILSNEQDETFIHLVYSSRTYDEILMKHTLDEMKAYWNFSVLYAVSKVSSSNKLNESVPCLVSYISCIIKKCVNEGEFSVIFLLLSSFRRILIQNLTLFLVGR